jgi:hypothetical protein
MRSTAATRKPCLHRTVELRDDEKFASGGVGFRMRDGAAEVEHGNRPAAHVGDAEQRTGRARQRVHRGTAQHFLHLEHVHAKKLATAEAKQEQGEPVVAREPGALVDAVDELRGHDETHRRRGRKLERRRGTRLASVHRARNGVSPCAASPPR